jgi:hypothetical protein
MQSSGEAGTANSGIIAYNWANVRIRNRHVRLPFPAGHVASQDKEKTHMGLTKAQRHNRMLDKVFEEAREISRRKFKAGFRELVKNIDGVNDLTDSRIEQIVSEVLEEFHR